MNQDTYRKLIYNEESTKKHRKLVAGSVLIATNKNNSNWLPADITARGVNIPLTSSSCGTHYGGLSSMQRFFVIKLLELEQSAYKTAV